MAARPGALDASPGVPAAGAPGAPDATGTPGASGPLGAASPRPTAPDRDSLARRLLARSRRQAWEAGVVRTSLRAGASLVGAQEGVAPWDQRRRRPAHDDQADDRSPGLSPGRDRPGPTRFDPQIGGRALRRYAREHGWAGMLAVARISVRWEQIVGSQVAQHARVEHFAPGRITLRASSSAWAQQLRLLMPGIERAVAGALEPGAGAVEIRVLGPASPTWRRERVAVRGSRGPRDTYG